MIVMMLVEFRCKDYAFDVLGYRVFKTSQEFTNFMEYYRKLAGMDKDPTTKELCEYFDCSENELDNELDLFARECEYQGAEDPAFYEMLRKELCECDFDVEFGDSEYLTFDSFEDFRECITVFATEPGFIYTMMKEETVKGIFPKERR